MSLRYRRRLRRQLTPRQLAAQRAQDDSDFELSVACSGFSAAITHGIQDADHLNRLQRLFNQTVVPLAREYFRREKAYDDSFKRGGSTSARRQPRAPQQKKAEKPK